ncbi:pyruvate ferredoxin oxidoreductase [Candidatus Kuenenbacteria bacterium]|nr:pyruvate ferredoxin oxidoreductase [Candidatus Kuenenbacteria bacterium]
MKQCIEGSHAVARIVNLCRPGVISAYPITPQTHIVEDLSKLKADGEGDFEYVRADSEFAAASIVLGASAAGVRTYTATSSQGLMLMAEVVFTISGMRLPVVMTCANRAISAPINIWNDQQDVMTVRDSGWILLFAEDNQDVIDMHIMAFKIAEQTKIPVMVNMDGFVLTHTFEPIDLPTQEQVDNYLPKYVPEPGQYLDTENPVSLGCFATPADYINIRQDLQNDLINSKKVIKKEFVNFKKAFSRGSSDLTEYYGAKNAKVVFVALGSVVGTIKEVVDEIPDSAVLSVKCLRPFPAEEIIKKLAKAKYVAVIDKSISLGNEGVLATEIKATLRNSKTKVQSFVAGLGGRDITRKMVGNIYKQVQKSSSKLTFIK